MSAITVTWKNCVGALPGNGGPEGVGCFVVSVLETETVNVTASNNVSSDATADDFGGSGNLINQSQYDLFADPLHGDFRLRPGSALIDAGANLSADFTTDIVGRTRPASGPWDIGAFEYVQQIGGYDFCYSYDEVGNRTRMVDIDGNVTTYVYDPANQLTSETSSLGTINYQYNGKGDRIVKDDPVAGITTYTYDSKSRMTGVITPDSAVTTLLYNAFDQLVEKQTPDGVWKYVYDGKVLLLETREDNATEVTYDSVLKDEYGELTSRYHDATAGTDYYQYDGLGSTDTLSDEAEADLDTYVYRAFGQIESQTGTEENKFTFIGRQGYHHWPELDLYFAGAGGGGQSAKEGQESNAGRMLDPLTGRFTSQDPIRENEKNRYPYADNNPVNKTDPSGNAALEVQRISRDWKWTNSPPEFFGTLVGVDGQAVMIQDYNGPTVTVPFASLDDFGKVAVVAAMRDTIRNMLSEAGGNQTHNLTEGESQRIRDLERKWEPLMFVTPSDIASQYNLGISLLNEATTFTNQLRKSVSEKVASRDQEEREQQESRLATSERIARAQIVGEIAKLLRELDVPVVADPSSMRLIIVGDLDADAEAAVRELNRRIALGEEATILEELIPQAEAAARERAWREAIDEGFRQLGMDLDRIPSQTAMEMIRKHGGIIDDRLFGTNPLVLAAISLPVKGPNQPKLVLRQNRYLLSEGDWSLVGVFPSNVTLRQTIENVYKDQEADALESAVAKAEFAFNFIPFFNAVDEFEKGNILEGGVSAAADIAMVGTGSLVKHLIKSATIARRVRLASAGLIGAVGLVRGAQGGYAFSQGRITEGAAYTAEALLRVFGVAVNLKAVADKKNFAAAKQILIARRKSLVGLAKGRVPGKRALDRLSPRRSVPYPDPAFAQLREEWSKHIDNIADGIIAKGRPKTIVLGEGGQGRIISFVKREPSRMTEYVEMRPEWLDYTAQDEVNTLTQSMSDETLEFNLLMIDRLHQRGFTFKVLRVASAAEATSDWLKAELELLERLGVKWEVIPQSRINEVKNFPPWR